jgi:hypothetical protein
MRLGKSLATGLLVGLLTSFLYIVVATLVGSAQRGPTEAVGGSVGGFPLAVTALVGFAIGFTLTSPGKWHRRRRRRRRTA